jgi:osmoprotectant transport system permease protein
VSPGIFAFLREHLDEVATRTLQHVGLSFGATLLALMLALPVGIAITRSPRLERPVLGFVDAVQTIPSLALFGLLLPLPLLGGIGATPAVVALVLYALLPIVRTTVVGIRSVDASVRDAAVGLGMTDRQLLLRVDLPLAAPTIVAGVRVAAVTSIGTATIAAAIGAGGLGDFVFRGVAVLDNRLILLGAVPAALLALIVDVLVRLVERRLAVLR